MKKAIIQLSKKQILFMIEELNFAKTNSTFWHQKLRIKNFETIDKILKDSLSIFDAPYPSEEDKDE